MILGASKTDINRWEFVVNGEGHATREGYTIVTIYLISNNKLRIISRFPIFFDFIVFPFFFMQEFYQCADHRYLKGEVCRELELW